MVKKRANMDIPAEELVLAEVIANAEEHGLAFLTEFSGLQAGDEHFILYSELSRKCCVIGAYLLGKQTQGMGPYERFRELTGLRPSHVYFGNDTESERGIADAVLISPDYQVGMAYRSYHLD